MNKSRDWKHTIRSVFEIRGILFFGFGDQRLVRFWKSPSYSLGKAEADLFLQCSDHECFLGVLQGQFHVFHPVNKSVIAYTPITLWSYHSVHFQVKPKLLRWCENQSINLYSNSRSIASTFLYRYRMARPRLGAIAAGAILQASVKTEW